MPKFKHTNTRSLYFPERVFPCMEMIFSHPLTVVEASMGYGKTTAVREFLNETTESVLWQSIFDSSTNSFWSKFCALFKELNASCAQSLENLGFPNDSTSIREAVSLIESLELPEKTVIVIDDYHIVENVEIDRLMEALVKNEIFNLNIILIMRYSRFQSLEEFSLKGYLNYVTQDVFEFSSKDIMEYYKLCGININAIEADKLYSYTEGWVSALYLLMLNYIAEGNIVTPASIYKLVEKSIYLPLPEKTQDFLLKICMFDSFTLEQAIHMSQQQDILHVLADITSKNALIKYDDRTKIYQIHNIMTTYLKDVLEQRDPAFRQKVYQMAGSWYMQHENYPEAMHFFYRTQEYDKLMLAMEMDKGHYFDAEHKDIGARYYNACPPTIRQKHPLAILAYAMCQITFNDIELFESLCGEFSCAIQTNDELDTELRERLLGEFELLLSFTEYNDIRKMSAHQKIACTLLKRPSEFLDTKGGWTFGSPSVLYLFYRESGTLTQTVEYLREGMPYYYQLTNGHGKGAEHVMASECYYNHGDMDNAEIALHKAFYDATMNSQPEILLCIFFLEARIALFKANYPGIIAALEKMHKEITRTKMYMLAHTIDICEGFIYAALKQIKKVPDWLAQGDLHSSRLFFQAKAFTNVIHGRVLLLNGEYLKLLGISGQFMEIASVFQNQLATIYIFIHAAAANWQLFRKEDALSALKTALDIAIADKIYMPFAENGHFIYQPLKMLLNDEQYHEGISEILKLYNSYQASIRQIENEYIKEIKPKLTDREREIAELAANGLTNREIGERLFISQNTIKTQLKSIFEKLDINSRALLSQQLK